jgi:hypothetical protein
MASRRKPAFINDPFASNTEEEAPPPLVKPSVQVPPPSVQVAALPEVKSVEKNLVVAEEKPISPEKPAALPAAEEQPAALPAAEEQPAALPVIEELPAALPVIEELPAALPAVEEQPAALPAVEEQSVPLPSVLPSIVEQERVEPSIKRQKRKPMIGNVPEEPLAQVEQAPAEIIVKEAAVESPVPEVEEQELVPAVVEEAPVAEVEEQELVPAVVEEAPVAEVEEQELVPAVVEEAPVAEAEEQELVPEVVEQSVIKEAPRNEVVEQEPVLAVIEEAPVIAVSAPAKRRKPMIGNTSQVPSSALFRSYEPEQLLEAWNTIADFAVRDQLIAELERREMFPTKSMKAWEDESGSYPDVKDPQFLQKLLSKREFHESLQETWKPTTDPCEDNGTFEVTPVQRFVSNFMSPKTPYMSALLYHGVGVGKTCGGVQITEAWLEFYPQTEVYIVAPPTIQKGFERTIFDINKVVIGEGNEPNTASQCTGTTYMRLTNTLYERELSKIEKAVSRLIKRRYKIYGYIQFGNFIQEQYKSVPKTIPKERRDELIKEILRRQFSGKLLIVDEAHNLREVMEEGEEEDIAFAGGKEEKGDAAAGKMLTPFLLDVLRYSEGMKFCCLTATPMYNTYREIIFMLNLLLLNDKKATIIASDIFDREGTITQNGAARLSNIAQRYVSFMRGENPSSFPIRLFPQVPALPAYPTLDPRGAPLQAEETTYYQKLPLAPIILQGETLRASMIFMNDLPKDGKGLSTIMLEKLVHAGNIVVPATDSTRGDTVEAYTLRANSESLWTVMDQQLIGGELRVRSKASVGAKWLVEGELANFSPKFEFFLKRIRNAEGCIFAYSRFVSGGALPLALVLEANGYTPYERRPILMDGNQAQGGRQCAMCPRKEREHASASHTFSPAYYGLITGNINLSPQNEKIIVAQRSIANKDGKIIKIVIGSQIASEGVDFRFIRETHVIDSWYHLNKTEQILGRAIRFLSHCALEKERRNNTVYLYVGVIPPNVSNRETADLLSYRMGFRKAVQIGRVTRIMKQSAVDCNLNKDAIIIRGEPPMKQIDAQRVEREAVNINDTPFTAVCDWIETCEYQCNPSLSMKELDIDDSTYDEFSARWRVHQIKERIKQMFSVQSFYQSEDLWNSMADIPRLAIVDVLHEIVNNRSFQVKYLETSGYIRYCNGYYLLQPNVYSDLTIPLAIRVAKFPVKRDKYSPIYQPDVSEQLDDVKVDDSAVPSVSIDRLWIALSRWSEYLSTNDVYVEQPEEVKQRQRDISQHDGERENKFEQIFEMIEWFHRAFHASTRKNSESFRRSLLFYFWDEWLSLSEQRRLVMTTSSTLECIRNDQYQFGKTLVNRYLDPISGSIVFECENGKDCIKSFVDDINRDTREPMRVFKVDRNTTGERYGFAVPKYKDVIFKTAEAPMPGGEIPRGKECANVSNTKGHISVLMTLGLILERHQRTDFQLNQINLIGEMKEMKPGKFKREGGVQNSIRLCTLTDFVLRYMDEEQIDKKKWFFRPIMSFYTGHKGLFRDGSTAE